MLMVKERDLDPDLEAHALRLAEKNWGPALPRSLQSAFGKLLSEQQQTKPWEDDGGSWYVFTTEPQSEFEATAGLIGRRMRAWCPTIKNPTRRSRKIVLVNRPMFVGYGFVRCVLNDDAWNTIRGTAGITRLLGTEGKPKSIAEEKIGALMFHEFECAKLPVIQPKFRLHGREHLGKIIEIREGKYAGFTGRIDSLDDEGRIAVLSIIATEGDPDTLHSA